MSSSDISAGAGTWDDSFIMSVFDAAITSHRVRTSADKSKKSTTPSRRSNGVGEPGPWVSVDESVAKNESGVKRSRQSLDKESTGCSSIGGSNRRQQQSSNLNAPAINHSSFPLQNQSAGHSTHQRENENGRGDYNYIATFPDPPLLSGPTPALLEEALHDMLAAWYQSGFASGRYFTLLEMSQRKEQGQGQGQGQGNEGFAETYHSASTS